MEYLCTTEQRMEDRIANRLVIRTLEDLNTVIVDTTNINNIIMKKEFIEAYFPFNSLSEYIRHVHTLNPNINFKTEDYEIAQVVDEDTMNLISENLNKEDLSMLLQFKSYDVLEVIFMLIEYYKNNKSYELEFSSVNSSLRETIDTLNETVTELNTKIDQEVMNKSDVQNKLSVLIDRINYTHNVGLDDSKLFKSTSNSYDRIIYVKEITRVQYVDSFMEALQETLSIMYNMPARYLCIESYYSDSKINLYPKHKPHYKLTEKDVMSGDILMLGYQPKLFTDIMKNTSNTSILVILDRGGYKIPHLIGDNVEYLYTVSDLADLDPKIPKSRVISYHEDTLFIPHIQGFKDLTVKEKVQKYSSLPIMKQVVSLLED